MSHFTPVLQLHELPETGSMVIEFEGKSVLICRDGNHFHAVENRCSHQFSPLEGGRIRNHHIACPKHGVRFDLRTGKPRGELTRKPIAVYRVRVIGDRIEIAAPD